ncbi:hypothetical protein [Burkholderia multivorans]|uniref:hypothetical protein n=1 Tax=Burkholderia multivorans TaxID=87883 RepID=UPI001C22AAA5|nr:hypothetical protein [Burkholderia multivorans]MBU9553880.1 hypothetical protein [Burkholderia multivorans]
MEQKQIDLELLAQFYRKRKIAEIPGYRYYEHLAVIMAMRKLGLKHRIIAEYLNVVVSNAPTKLTNTTLCAYISKWKKLGKINISDKEVKKLAEQIVATELGAKVIADVIVEPNTVRKANQFEEINKELPKWNNNQFEDTQKSDDPFAVTLLNNFESGIKEEPKISLLEFMKLVGKGFDRELNDTEKSVMKSYYHSNVDLLASDQLVSSCIDTLKGNHEQN